MTGPIDPLLGRTSDPTPDPASTSPGALRHDPTGGLRREAHGDQRGDLTGVLADQRAQLVRLAALITLDHVLAEEVVQEGFVQLQRRVAAAGDAPGELRRSVVQVAVDAARQHRRGRVRRALTIRAHREFVAARRPVPVEPTGLPPELAATWAAIAALAVRRRALLGLQWCAGLRPDELADAVVWPDGMVVSARRATERRLRRVLDLSAGELEARLAATFAAVGPQLARAEVSARTAPRPAPATPSRVRPAPVGAVIDPTPAGARVRVWSSIERRPSRARTLVVAGSVGALAVGAVTWYSLSTGDDGTTTAVTADTDEAPTWYRAIAPLLPPGFDHVALVGVDGAAVTYVAIDVERGTSLDISISRRDSTSTAGAEVDVQCSVVGGTLAATDPGPCTLGVPVQVTTPSAAGGSAGSAGPDDPDRPDGAGTTPSTQVAPLDPTAVAATISTGFDLSAILSDLDADIEDSFGSPAGVRTAMARIDTVVARAVPDQVEVGRTSVHDGVEQHLEYARAAGRDPITTLTVLHGVYPPAAGRLGGTLTDHGDVLAGWILAADGRAFRVTSVDGARTDVAALEGLLADLTEVPAEAATADTTA